MPEYAWKMFSLRYFPSVLVLLGWSCHFAFQLHPNGLGETTKTDSMGYQFILFSFFLFFLLTLGVPQAILLIMATPSCGF
jgi:hypothetical protein